MKIQKNELGDPINGRSNVWRYMPIEKFIDLITSHSLYFPNARSFTDQYEVSIPEALRDDYLKSHSTQEYEHKATTIETVRKQLFLNCWSIQTHESYALWKIYLAGSKAGVAIKSSVAKLKNSLIKENTNSPVDCLHIERVQYKKRGILFEVPTVTNIAATKTAYYEYEKELRLFFLDDRKIADSLAPPVPGYRVRVDVDELVDSIYLSPFGGSWVRESFSKMLQKLHPALKTKLKASEILDQ